MNLPEILLRRIRVQGIFVGSRAELERYVSFVAANAIKPVIHRRSTAWRPPAMPSPTCSPVDTWKIVIRVGG